MKEFYEIIENIIEYKQSFSFRKIINLLISIRDSNVSEDISNKAQWEMYCFDFGIIEGELIPIYESINKENKKVVFPDINLFTDETFNYIENRIKNTDNSFIKSRYAVIMWKGKRRYEFAVMAIEEYLKCINKILTSNLEDIDFYKFINYIKNAYVIGLKINYNKNKLNQMLLDLIKNSKFNNCTVFKYSLIEFLWNQRKNFNKKEDFYGIEICCWDLALNAKDKRDYYSVFKISSFGEKIEQVLNQKTFNWIHLNAETYELMAMESEGFLKIEHLNNAITLYKNLKNDEKVNELNEKVNDVKYDIEPNEISFTFEFNDLFNEIKNKTKILCKKGSAAILNNLMNECLSESYTELYNIVKDNSSPLKNIFSIVLIDENRNISKKYNSNDDIIHFEMMKYYNLFIQTVITPYLDCLLIESIKNDKLSPEIIVDFIQKETWMGYELNNNGQQYFNVNHLFYLVPILNQYFYEFYIYIKYPEYNPNFVLTIDSLVLKIEGIIRDFCKKLSIPTINTKEGNSEEKSLNLLLDEPEFEENIGHDDLLFLKYLLTDKAGKNLRNKVAHSLMYPHDYNLSNANLLLLALFKLIKYEFYQE